MNDAPAGWYRDPHRPSLHRYWNGENWTELVGEHLDSRFRGVDHHLLQAQDRH
jgi:hypothetical protein